jgi:hypothetical protein
LKLGLNHFLSSLFPFHHSLITVSESGRFYVGVAFIIMTVYFLAYFPKMKVGLSVCLSVSPPLITSELLGRSLVGR